MAGEENILGDYADIGTEPSSNIAANTDAILGNNYQTTIGTPTQLSEDQFGRNMLYGLPGLAAGLVDTIGTSIGVLKDSDVSTGLKTVFGDNGFGDWYTRNRDPVRAGSDIIGMFIPGTLGMKVLKSARAAREAGTFGDFLKNSTTVDALLGNSARLTKLQEGITAAGTDAAEQFGSISGRTLATEATQAAKGAYYKGALAESLRQGVVFETMYAGMFNNSVLFPADATTADYAKWGVAGVAASAGIEHVAARFAAFKLLRSAGQAVVEQAATGKPLQSVLSNVIYRPNDRGVGISLTASMKQDTLHDLATPGLSADARTNLTQDVTQFDSILGTQLGKLARDENPFNLAPPVPIQVHAAGTRVNPAHEALFRQVLSDNPMALNSAKNITLLPEDTDAFFSSYDSTMRKLRSTLTPESTIEQRAAVENMQRKFYTIEGDGSMALLRGRASTYFDNHDMADIAFQHATTPTASLPQDVLQTSGIQPNSKGNATIGTWSATSGSGNKVSVDELCHITMPKSPTQDDFVALQGVGSKIAQHFADATSIVKPLLVSPSRPWRELDLIQSIAAKNPAFANSLVLGGSFNTVDDVLYHVTNERYKEFVQMLPKVQSGIKRKSLTAAMPQAVTPQEMKMRLNMPADIFDHAAPFTQFFAEQAAAGIRDLDEIFGGTTESKVGLLRAAVRDTGNLESTSNVPIAMSGNAFSQSGVKPILVHAAEIPPLAKSDTYLQAAVTQLRQDQIAKMAAVTPDKSPMVASVVSELSGLPALDEARKVQNLMEGATPGRGIMVAADRLNQYNSTMKAMQLVSTMSDLTIQKRAEDLMQPLTAVTSKLTDKRNATDAIDFNRVQHAYRHGFVVDHVEYVPINIPEDGKEPQTIARFVLDKNDPRNEVALHRYFGDKAPSLRDDGDVYLPDMLVHKRDLYTPLEVSSTAGNAADIMSSITVNVGKEANVIRQLAGQAPIELRNFHLLPPELNSDKAWFVQDSRGKTINIYSRGDLRKNEKDAKAAADALSKTTHENHIAIPGDQIKAQAAVDNNFFNLVDYSDYLAKNKSMKGGLIEAKIDTTTAPYLAAVKSLTDAYMSVGTRTRALLLEPQLNYARTAARVTPKYAGGPLGEYNIFDRYVRTAYSLPTRNPNGVVAKLYGGIEGTLDSGLSVAQHVFEKAIGKDNKDTADYIKNHLDKSVFNQYQKAAEEWTPFKTITQWLDSTYHGTSPWTSKAAVTKLSQISNALALRILNPGTALLNYVGVATVMPAVVASMRQRIGETEADYAARWALWGTDFNTGTPAFSPMKALVRGTKDLFNGSLSEPLKKAEASGMLKPEFTVLDNLLAQENPGKRGWLDRVIDTSSYLADKSEEQSRRISWGIGYAMAKDLFGVKDERNRFLFAQHMVNQVIGNYTTTNRPGLFQGALGIPLGAFQTYMFNYYRRLFSYVENKDYRSLATQFAMQGSVFGAAGLPGWNMYNQYIGSDQVQADTFESRINRTLTPTESELLLHGTLSNIPRMFGQDGFALYSRGSVDMTKYMPGIGDILTATPTPFTYLYDANKLPPLQFLTNTGNAIGETLGNVLHGFSSQQQAEILAHYSTNRFFKSAMEIASGNTTDRSGQLISDDTRSFAKIAATFAGTVPTEEREMQDAYYKQRIVEANQSALRKELNVRTRALIRSGNFGVDDFQDAIYGYVASGGNPDHFGSWLRDNMITATQSKQDIKLKQLMNSGRGVEFQNMLAAMSHAPDNDDAESSQEDFGG